MVVLDFKMAVNQNSRQVSLLLSVYRLSGLGINVVLFIKKIRVTNVSERRERHSFSYEGRVQENGAHFTLLQID